MINIAEIKIGEKVHYTPFEGCDESAIENGMVKEIPDHTNDHIRVVFNCAGEWNNFMNYTSPINKLEKGWKH